ncbi:nucleotide modification associated domain-containing protein [Lactobacillus intestinalis]|uniref:nucleotide modification associated domain-containing protein n=1 Tax=Lactobacillus intestinalis TaxID=151781 RepID=UPI0025A613CD|nr:nucleotide modification associated domain-containing protein [Lactobacillus intestinalis]
MVTVLLNRLIKYNRIEHLITNNELKENDESLEDTLLDMAGYSILALRYLKEHKDENYRG